MGLENFDEVDKNYYEEKVLSLWRIGNKDKIKKILIYFLVLLDII